MFIKNLRKTLIVFSLAACNAIPVPGNVDDAEVFHWENDYVVMAKFVEDHKLCFGVKQQRVKTQMGNLFGNMRPATVPKWDGIWSTFESRSHREVGQRISFSMPNDGGSYNPNAYRQCMIDLGYRLTYKRY